MIFNNRHSLWQLAFRPAFLLGTFYGGFTILAWIGFYTGTVEYIGKLPLLAWHIHEIVIGFISLIIFGFLFTATQNWTGIRGINGGKLQLLILIWFLGRLISFSTMNSQWLLVFDILYLGLAGFLLLPYLKSKSQNRNKVFIFTTIGFILFAVLLCYLSITQKIMTIRDIGLIGVGIVFLVISIIAGRIIPFFTKNALKNSLATKNESLEWLSHVFSVLPFIIYITINNKHISMIFFILAGVTHLIRWTLWRPWQSIKNPILLILPLSYMWTFIGFFLLSISMIYNHIFSLALHSINIGLIGSIIIAMISRVSLGHTGRQIRATKLMILSYIFIQLTALFRLIFGQLESFNYLTSVKISGLLWTVAFSLLFINLIPILTKPRVDNKIG